MKNIPGSPRQKGLPRRKDLPRQKGPPRRGHVRLGELEDKKNGPFGPPRRGCYSPRRTTSPRRRKATPRRAYDCLRPMFMAILRSVLWPCL